MGHNRDALVKKQSSWKLDIKFIALITEAKKTYSMELWVNFY